MIYIILALSILCIQLGYMVYKYRNVALHWQGEEALRRYKIKSAIHQYRSDRDIDQILGEIEG